MNSLYGFLLLLYPKAFREDYGREMTRAFRDRWQREPGLMLALSTLFDMVFTAMQVHGEMLGQDLNYAERGLRRNPGFAIPAILTLGLGIGATTAMFSLVNAVLLRPLPLDEPQRIVLIRDVNPTLQIMDFASSEPNFVSWRERAHSFSAMAAFRTIEMNLMHGGAPARVTGLAVRGDFWKTMGTGLLRGRGFTAEEHREGNHRVALLGEGLWQRSFGGDPAVLGRTLELSDERYTIVGIAPSYLAFSSNIEIVVPLVEDPDSRSRGDRRVAVAARLRPGVPLGQADAEMMRITGELDTEFPGANRGWRVRLVSFDDWILEPAMRRSLWLLLGAVGLLWMLACANVANLLLARAVARQREIGVRLALGASRARLRRQVFTESLFLGGLGGAAGLAIAWLMLRGFTPFLPADLTGAGREPGIDSTVLCFALLVTFAASLLFGAAPAFLYARDSVRGALTSGRSGAMADPARLRQVLAAGQVGLAATLLIGALLMLASFTRMMRVDLGFRQDPLLLARFNPRPAKMTSAEAGLAYYDRILAEIRGLPGVAAAGIASEIPLGPETTELAALPAEQAARIQTEGVQTQWRIVTDGFLETMGIPLLRGRMWTASERGRPLPVLISDSLRRRFWPAGEDPLGRTIRLGNGQSYRIVGVTGDVKQLSLLAENPTHTIYLPPWFMYWPTMNLVVRTASGDPAAQSAALREAVRRADPSQPVYDVRTMRGFVSTVVERPRLAAWLLGGFAVLALMLASVGVAGLVAYAVTRRRPELAIRLALGATPGRVTAEVTRAHLGVCAIGLLLGIGGAYALRPVIGALLFGVDAGDPAIFGLATGLLLAVAALACWLPARRITRIDPAVALRSE